MIMRAVDYVYADNFKLSITRLRMQTDERASRATENT